MSQIRFRAGTPADNAFFRKLEFQTTWDSLDPEDRTRFTSGDIREALDDTLEILLERPGNRIIIAENEAGERVGLLWFGFSRNLITGEDEAWVYNITVVPEHQKKGIGRQLLQHAEELARQDGFQVLGLMVSSHNTAARALYESASFRATNLVMRKHLIQD